MKGSYVTDLADAEWECLSSSPGAVEIAAFSVRDDLLSSAHELVVLEFVGFAPSLQPLRVNAEVEVGGSELARIEAGFGREGVADLVRNLGSLQCVRSSLDEDESSGRADAEADLVGGLQIAAGQAGGRCGGPGPRARDAFLCGWLPTGR